VCQVSTSLHNSMNARLNRFHLVLICAHQDVKIFSNLSNPKLHTHNHNRLPAFLSTATQTQYTFSHWTWLRLI